MTDQSLSVPAPTAKLWQSALQMPTWCDAAVTNFWPPNTILLLKTRQDCRAKPAVKHTVMFSVVT
jgi:hypothetical protein